MSILLLLLPRRLRAPLAAEALRLSVGARALSTRRVANALLVLDMVLVVFPRRLRLLLRLRRRTCDVCRSLCLDRCRRLRVALQRVTARRGTDTLLDFVFVAPRVDA